MAEFRPRSTLGLTVTAFAVVVLPLAVAVVSGIVAIDQVAEDGEAAAFRFSEASASGRLIAERVIAMERALGQYGLLGDDSFLQTYLDRREEFLEAADTLARLDLGDRHRERVSALLTIERELFAGHERFSARESDDHWSRLSDEARALLEESRTLVQAEVLAATQAARDLQRRLFIQTAAALPVSILLAALFTVLINRPIRQIDSAIRRLAADSTHDAVSIQGPRDLREIGECIDALRQRIVSLEREKLVFVRRLSHELKTPLAAIRQGAELLADPSGTPPNETVEIGLLLKESSIELQGLIEDLLEFGKTQRLGHGRTLERVRIDELLGRILNDYVVALRAKGVVLRSELVPAALDGDARQLKTALKNVISNAVKYAPPGGMLEVTMRMAPAELQVDVSDSGPGIPESERPHVFEPFFQGAPALGEHVKGTGLGLAIAKEYVEAHDGRLELLESDSGARFRLAFPLVETTR